MTLSQSNRCPQTRLTCCTLSFHKCTYILCDMHNTLRDEFIRDEHTVSLVGEVLKRHFLQRDTQHDWKWVIECEISNIFIKSRKCSGSFTPVNGCAQNVHFNKTASSFAIRWHLWFSMVSWLFQRWSETMFFLKGEKGSTDLLYHVLTTTKANLECPIIYKNGS